MRKIEVYAAVFLSLMIAGITACQHENNPVTGLQKTDGIFSSVPRAAAALQPAVQVSTKNDRVNVTLREDASATPYPVDVMNWNKPGWGIDVAIYQAGDYAITYQIAKGVEYILFFKALAPGVINIGVKPKNMVQNVVVFYGFAYKAADVAMLKYKRGEMYFLSVSAMVSSAELMAEFLDTYHPKRLSFPDDVLFLIPVYDENGNVVNWNPGEIGQ